MKKYISVLLALTLCITSIQALAIKRDEKDEVSQTIGENLCFFGTFESQNDAYRMNRNTDAVISWQEGGALGSKGCLKVFAHRYGYPYISVPYVVGETYDISFYARVDETQENRTLQVIPRMTIGSYDTTILKDSYTTEWKKYTCSYYADGKNASGAQAGGLLQIGDFRCGDGNTAATYYIDNLEIRPRGNVAGAQFPQFNFDDDSVSDTQYVAPQPYVGESFSDTKDHWAQKTVELLSASSYVEGMGDGTFAPDSRVTRAQFITMAMKTLRYDNAGYQGIFADVTQGDWFADNVQNAYDLGLLSDAMTAGGTFEPDQPITREEAAYVISKLAERKGASGANGKSFTDAADISSWASNAVCVASDCGIIGGYPDGSFKPKNSITRAESAAMIKRLIELDSVMAVFVDGAKGSDENDGTESAPFKTLEKARDFIRPYLDTMQHHIFVYIKEGEYKRTERFELGTQDSGENGFSVIYTSWNEEKPVITMGDEYTGFELYDEAKGIYRTRVGRDVQITDVFINDVRAVMARKEAVPAGVKSVLNNAAEKNPECILTNVEFDQTAGVYICDDRELLSYKNVSDIKLCYYEAFHQVKVHIASITETEDGRVKITMQQDEWAVEQAHGNAGMRPKYPEWIENAYELLDAKGEWYHNKQDGYLYYRPRDYENPETMVATVPAGEIAFWIVGDSVDEKVHNIKIDNLAFQYTTWFYPLEEYVPISYGVQVDGRVPGDGNITKDAATSAVIVADATYIDFTNNEISKTGSTGISFFNTFQNIAFNGNHLYDIGGNGMNLGKMGANEHGYLGLTENYYKNSNPTEYKYFRTNINVLNNLIHDTGKVYENSTGIYFGHLKKLNIKHNEIYNSPYAGMLGLNTFNNLKQTGAGSRNIEIMYNYVHDTADSNLYDTGAIYVNGETGGNSGNYNKISYNYLENPRNNYATLYLDEGSSYWEVAGNVSELREMGDKIGNMHIWTDSIRNNYVHDNYATTAKSTNASPYNDYEPAVVIADGNWPEEAQQVMDIAGLEKPYLTVYPDSVQRLKLLSRDNYTLDVGDSVQMEITGFKRKMNEADLSGKDFSFYSTNESIATVDENGRITTVGAGTCDIFCEYLDGTVIRRVHSKIDCVDGFKDIILPEKDVIKILPGADDKSIAANGITEEGKTVTIGKTEFIVENPEVISVSADGTITGLKLGSTKVKATYAGGGITKEKEYRIDCVPYNYGDDTLALVEQSRKLTTNDAILNPSNWTNKASAYAGGGIDVAKAAPEYCTIPLDNQLVSFDLTITSPTTWPSLTFALDKEGMAGEGAYLFGFKSGYVEAQRFTLGKRTAGFFGGQPDFVPVVAEGYPNLSPDNKQIYKTGERFSVTAGALDAENGTRLVLIINGIPIIDYVDDTEGNIQGDFLMGVYNGSGSFIFQPFTDIQLETQE